jgi:hypothetical protein
LTYPSEKYEFVSWDYCSQLIWENNSHVPSSKPPTRKDEKIGTHQQTSPNTDGHLVNQIPTDHAKRPKRELSGRNATHVGPTF